jgi:hypothetical protein
VIPAPPPPKAPVSSADLIVSIVALVLTVGVGAGAALMGFFLVAFLDNCPPETCSAEGAVTAVGAALIAAVVLGIVGTIVTVVALVRRTPAWPFAVGTLLLCGLVCLIGVAGYFSAVGA